MTAGTELDELLARIRSVYLRPGTGPGPAPMPASGLKAPALEPEAEVELAKIMELLRTVSSSAELPLTVPAPPEHAVPTALGGAELVMRWRYLDGRRAEIPGLLPGALFLVTVLLLDREEALRRSDEVRRLVAAAGF